jgi:hypothetical protein
MGIRHAILVAAEVSYDDFFHSTYGIPFVRVYHCDGRSSVSVMAPPHTIILKHMTQAELDLVDPAIKHTGQPSCRTARLSTRNGKSRSATSVRCACITSAPSWPRRQASLRSCTTTPPVDRGNACQSTGPRFTRSAIPRPAHRHGLTDDTASP